MKFSCCGLWGIGRMLSLLGRGEWGLGGMLSPGLQYLSSLSSLPGKLDVYLPSFPCSPRLSSSLSSSSHSYFNLFLNLWLLWVFTVSCGLSLVAESQGCSLAVVHSLLLAGASLIEGHRLSAHGLHSCGIGAQLLCGMWNLPGRGIEPGSPALSARFLSTVPPGKSHLLHLMPACRHPLWKYLDTLKEEDSHFIFKTKVRMRMRVVWYKFSERYKFICRNKILPGPKSQWNEPPSHSPYIPSFRQITILSHLFERLDVLWS